MDNMVPEYSVAVDAVEPTLVDENRALRETVEELSGELRKFKQSPLLVTEIVEKLKNGEFLIRLRNESEFCVKAAKDLEGVLEIEDRVLVDQKSLTVVKRIGKTKDFNVNNFVIVEKPKTHWNEIGGLKDKVEELKEVIELPLKKPELFKEVGIDPPKGVLLYGPPGTGKTLLAKAVAQSTNATFIEIVGSEMVQKFIGQGTKLVKSIFKLAREKGPAIIFIDEIDAIASRRVELGTSGEREVQRTFMQLLAEIDGFKTLGNVKVIGATNRADILDPAVIRPGRLDRLMEIGLPDDEGRKQIFTIHTKRMTLDSDVDLDALAKKTKGLCGAEIKAVCTEAGYFAIRANKKQVSMHDMVKAISKVKAEEEKDPKYLHYIG